MVLNIQAKITIKKDKLKAMPEKLDLAIVRGLQRGAFEVERKAKSYAPYDTGALMRSIGTTAVKRAPNSFSVSVAPHVEYAEIMEEPGRVRRRGRRPYMKPALLDSISKIINILKEEIKGVVK